MTQRMVRFEDDAFWARLRDLTNEVRAELQLRSNPSSEGNPVFRMLTNDELVLLRETLLRRRQQREGELVDGSALSRVFVSIMCGAHGDRSELGTRQRLEHVVEFLRSDRRGDDSGLDTGDPAVTARAIRWSNVIAGLSAEDIDWVLSALTMVEIAVLLDMRRLAEHGELARGEQALCILLLQRFATTDDAAAAIARPDSVALADLALLVRGLLPYPTR